MASISSSFFQTTNQGFVFSWLKFPQPRHCLLRAQWIQHLREARLVCPTWMSRWILGSMGYNPNVCPLNLEVGEITHLLTIDPNFQRDIQVRIRDATPIQSYSFRMGLEPEKSYSIGNFLGRVQISHPKIWTWKAGNQTSKPFTQKQSQLLIRLLGL